MTASAVKGPLIVYGQRPPLGSGGSENTDLAPSLFWGGIGLIDPRWGYNTTRSGAIGWYGADAPMLVNQIPSAISAVNIAALQVPVAGTALTLVSTTGAGVTVLSAAQSISVVGNFSVIPAGALALDGVAGIVAFGRAKNSASGWTELSFYDPAKAISRNVRITSVGDDSGATFLVSGYDIYGSPMSERITGATAGNTASGKKAFKYVTSIVPAGTLSGSNVSVGTGDVYGFPLYVPQWELVNIHWAGALITSSTGFLAGDSTSPATALTGDVRGTYTTQSASNGTNRLVVYASPSVNNVANGNVGLFGVTQA